MKNKKAPAFTRKLISLVMPIAFQQFMLALVSASDALMLGVISQDSLSAVSLAGQITFIHNLLLEAMTIGLSLIAAQYWGKGDIPEVERIFAFVMKVTTVISLVFTLSALLIPGMLGQKICRFHHRRCSAGYSSTAALWRSSPKRFSGMLFFNFISHSENGLDVCGVLGVRLQLASQPPDCVVHRVGA